MPYPQRGHLERGERVHEAGRKPSQPAVAEGGIGLRLLDDFQRNTHLAKRVPAQIVDAQIAQSCW